jgi:Arc/MetJ-type ribon-helix-helix transcriptional regulator
MNREKRYENRIALRLPTKEKQQIEQLIQKGKFKNLSETIRAALKEFMKAA